MGEIALTLLREIAYQLALMNERAQTEVKK